MVRFEPYSVALTILVSICVPLQAQSGTEALPVPPNAKPVPSAVLSRPFSIKTAMESVTSIEFRTADQISQSDRLLAANAESSIAERAAVNAIELKLGDWSHRQIVCPALPHHLFLQYSRNSGTGDTTEFSASIPRDGGGRVRIIPILRRGYLLFSPAPINALTIAVFNHIRAEEPQAQQSSSWMGNALCYAALAGAHPQFASPDEEPGSRTFIPAQTAMMDIQTKGGQIIRFADAAATPRPMEWTMTFASNGKLINATHVPARLIAEKPVPEAVETSQPVPPIH